MERAENTTTHPPLTPGLLWSFKDFRRRLEYVGGSYNYWKDAEKDRPTFNQSLELLRRELEVPKRKRREPVRLHPWIEIGVSIIAHKIQPNLTGDMDWTSTAIEAATRELLRRTRPIRGRPENANLRYHVKGLILACERATGMPVTASSLTNSDYGPQMTSDGGKAIEMAFRRIDPSVTRTSLVNIIRQTRASGELIDKRFKDLFPLYQSEPHPEFGISARQSIDVYFAHPIYCS